MPTWDPTDLSNNPCLSLLLSQKFSLYTVDDNVFGLNADQKQLRATIHNFCQKELAPHADVIDKQNDFLTKKKDPVVKSHHTDSPHGSGQSTSRDLPPLPSRGAVHLSRGKELFT